MLLRILEQALPRALTGPARAAAICAVALTNTAFAQNDAPTDLPPPLAAGEDWPTYHGSPAATHYSPLTQVNTNNVAQLRVAWTYDSADASRNSRSEMQSNPLIVAGRLVFASPRGRIICLDGQTGKERWIFDPGERNAGPRWERSRGVAYWTDGKEERVLFTFRHHLLALDLHTGTLIRSFGSDGRVDLRDGLGRDPALLSVSNVTPGVIYRDVLIVGSTGNTPGHVRAYDVRTGWIRWTFHTIPYPGEPGYESWPKDAWQRSFGANVWAGMALDTESGTVFLPTASGGMGVKDFYGADRLGDNLYANSLVALDALTGKLRWYFQTVRHDLWDRDLPAQPTLVEVRRSGRKIRAVAQVTKSGYIFILDRNSGKSLFPLEERAMLPSDIPGEVAAQKQIVPRLPQPFARQHLTADLLTRRTPAAHRAVLHEFARHRSHGQFDPPSLQGTIIFPGLDGGAEWGGAAYDPQTGLLYVNSNEMAWVLKLTPRTPLALGSDGESLYRSHCASCHGSDLRGSLPEFPALTGAMHRLTDSQITSQILAGSGRMPAFGYLSPTDIASLVRYVGTRGANTAGANTAPVGTFTSQPDATASGRTYESSIGSNEPFVFDGYKRFLDPDGYPAIAPPWGTLSAIDVSTGRYAWQIPFGEYPELAAQGMTNTGSENYGGAVVTAGGLLFIGATVYDNKFHAYDKQTGRLLWETRLPAAAIASPSTYMVNGRQFVVIAAGGGKNIRGTSGGSLVAFALPERLAESASRAIGDSR
jgi:quinoprotein glucose dehydrogenase